MKRIEALDQALNEQVRNLNDLEINPTLMKAYRTSLKVGNDHINFEEVIWDREIEPITSFLKANGIRTHVLKKISEDAEEIAEAIRQGHIAYVINTSDPSSSGVIRDGFEIRKYATENNVTMFTSLDTVRVLLDVLEETTLTISTIDS